MATDPYWSNVVLRQTFDVDLSDVSGSAHPVIAEGAGVSITSAAKFGNAVNLASSFGRKLRVPHSSDFAFGAGDFTVEFWLNFPVTTLYTTDLLSVYSRASNQRAWVIGATNSRILYVYISSNGTSPNIVNRPTVGTAIPLDTWVHLCLERSGSTFRLYRNGVMVSKDTSSLSLFGSDADLIINGVYDDTANTHRIYVDDTRITKGLARYASDAGFAVPTAPYPTSGGVGPIEVNPAAGLTRVSGKAPALVTGLHIAPPTGKLGIAGLTPALSEFSGVVPSPGQTVVEGAVPELGLALILDPPPGDLQLVGKTPGVFVGVALTPGLGQLQIDGFAPVLFTVSGTAASQLAMLSLALPTPPPTRASQIAGLALAEPPPPPVHASQAAVLTIGEIVPDVLASQLAVLALGHGSACVTERCQIWKITRRDGRVFRYTSHDRPVRYGGQVYQSCRSLNPSASENASSLGSVGNIELTGIIDDDGISEADLYGGLFDDAFVTVDLITWGAGTETPRRLASGWTGALSQGETSFNMEVLGSGARLEQQALVQMVTPGCRWVFGSSECGVNAEALKVSGAVVSARTRGAFKATLSGGAGSSQWQNGRVRWTSGANLGQVTETKTVDFATGEIVLWASPGYIAAPGDTFDVLPGCDFARDGGCTVYANTINFGGFPDVPGSDAILETPLAQY